MTAGVRVNVCRPGFGASCALCCGSHNYRASKEEIGTLFSRRSELLSQYNKGYLIRAMSASRSSLTGSYYYRQEEGLTLTLPALFEDCPCCPFAGYVDGDRHAGCLLYPEDHPPELRYECFQSYRGKLFSCQAWDILSDNEVLYAARLTGDWYYYSIIIHDVETLRHLMGTWPHPADIPAKYFEDLKIRLNERVASDGQFHSIHSYFSWLV